MLNKRIVRKYFAEVTPHEVPPPLISPKTLLISVGPYRLIIIAPCPLQKYMYLLKNANYTDSQFHITLPEAQIKLSSFIIFRHFIAFD